MQHAARLTALPSTRTLVVPLVSLVIGAAAATGAYALIDNGDAAAPSAKVVFVDVPATGAAQTAAVDQSAIGGSQLSGARP